MEKIKRVTTDELAIMINNGFKSVEKDIKEIKEDIAVLKTDVSVLKTDVSVLKTDVSVLKTDVSVLKTITATKSFITDQIADLKGGFVISIKREDEKVEKTIDRLENKKIFNSQDVEELKSIKVFAKTA